MKRIVSLMVLGCVWALGARALAQEKTPKMAIINIQIAIAQSNEGQEAARTIQTRFGPRRAELEKQQKEINDLQTQVRNQEKTLSDEARTRLMRSIDDKTKLFNRSNEDATAEFQQAEQDAINEIGRKMMGIITDYAQKSGYAVVLDISSPQTPVLYADAGIDITQKIIELYNEGTAKPAASSTPAPTSTPQPAAAPAPKAAEPSPKPPPSSPAATP